jgi:hypothetical protein
MTPLLRSPARALGYALVLLTVGFVWGAVSANVAVLRTAPPIPHFAHNGAVALPILLAWSTLAYVLARRYFTHTDAAATEGLRLGALFAAAALAFDLVVVAGIVGEGWRHFEQPVLWLAYVLLVAIPWLVGREFGVSGSA